MALPQPTWRGFQCTRILRVETGLDGMARDGDVLLRHRQALTCRYSDSQRYEVKSSDHLGDSMLDLDSWIDLEEVEFAMVISEKFEGCKSLVSHGLGTFDYT